MRARARTYKHLFRSLAVLVFTLICVSAGSAEARPYVCETLFASPGIRISIPESEQKLSALGVHYLQADFKFTFKSAELLSRENIFSDSRYFKFWNRHSQAARLYAQNWYGLDIIGEAGERIGQKLSILLMDPGIAQFYSEFIAFVAERPHLAKSNLMDVRKAFSNHMGTQEVYRGLSLKPEDVIRLKEEGIFPRPVVTEGVQYKRWMIEDALRASKTSALPELTLEKRPDYMTRDESFASIGPELAFDLHTRQRGSLAMSVTASKIVATSVATRFGKLEKDARKEIYVFTIDQPKIELFQTGHPDFDQLGLFDKLEKKRMKTPFKINGNLIPDSSLEWFVLGKIKAENIRGVENMGRPVNDQWTNE